MRTLVGRLARAVLWSTLAAGAVGVLRQRREALGVRAGVRPPASAMSDPTPTRPAGPFAASLATWHPAPLTGWRAVAAAVWAAPMSSVGFVLALLGGARPRWDEDRRCWVAVGVGGLSARALAAVGADANTVGQVVLARSPAPAARLLDHEAVHVRQSERLGPLLLVAYVWLGARYGYRDHPLERAARAGARAAAHGGRTELS